MVPATIKKNGYKMTRLLKNPLKLQFREFFSERDGLFRPRKGQASDEVARGPAPYNNRTMDFFESLL